MDGRFLLGYASRANQSQQTYSVRNGKPRSVRFASLGRVVEPPYVLGRHGSQRGFGTNMPATVEAMSLSVLHN